MKTIFSWFVIFSLLGQSTAWAGATHSNPQQALALVEEYLAMQKTKIESKDPTGQLFTEMGQSQYVQQRVATQIISLEPADFNVFLFYFLERYIKNPTERKTLSDLLATIRQPIEGDLATTALLNEGPADSVIEASYQWGTWILLGGVLGVFTWKYIVSKPLPSVAFTEAISVQQSSTLAGRVARAGKRLGKSLHWAGAASAAGALGGYVRYVIETNQTHRLDPLLMLHVVQAQLACKLSYAALTAHDKFQKAFDQDNTLKNDAKPLTEELTTIHDQVVDLVKQFPQLFSLDMKDRLFQNSLRMVPPAKDWQEYRKNLTSEDQSHDGLCRSVRMYYVQNSLQSDIDAVATLAAAFAPPPPSPEEQLKTQKTDSTAPPAPVQPGTQP